MNLFIIRNSNRIPRPAPTVTAGKDMSVSLQEALQRPWRRLQRQLRLHQQAATDLSQKSASLPLKPLPIPLLLPVAAPQPSAQPSPLKGAGYGASNVLDPASGKPLLAYENEAAKSSRF